MTDPTPRCPAAAAAAVEPLEARRLFASFDVLVFSKTDDFRHVSIPDGIAAIEALGDDHNFTVTATEDATKISTANLAQYEAVVFLSTTGDFLNDTQQAAMEGYIAAGGGWVGIHGASVGEEDWDWYGGLLGARFDDEATPRDADVLVEDPNDPLVSGIPDPWERFDELYNFQTNPRDAGVDVLLTLDEDSYEGGTMGDDHPIAWAHEYMGGRAFYTGLGHTVDGYDEPIFRRLLLNGILYAADLEPPTADASADVLTGAAPFNVNFSSAPTTAGDRGPLTYAWDFDSDGSIDSTAANPSHVYGAPGAYTAKFLVTNADGVTSRDLLTVTVTEPPANQPPIANADAATTPFGVAVSIDVLANDTDDDGALDAASIIFVSQPAGGTLTLNAATGAVVYTPNAGYAGLDSFAYTVRDTEGMVSGDASVLVTVTPPTTPTPTATLVLALTGDLPAAVVAGEGAKATVVATVTNVTSSPFAGRVTIDLGASTDNAFGDVLAAPLGSLTRNLKLPAGGSRSIPLKVRAVPAVADGSYYVIGRASSPLVEASNLAATAGRMSIAAPFRDLSVGYDVPPPGGAAAGSRSSIRLVLTNGGNVIASGTLPVAVRGLSTFGEATLADLLSRVKLKPGAQKVLKLRLTWPTQPADYAVSAIISPAGFGDIDHGNDAAVAATVTVT